MTGMCFSIMWFSFRSYRLIALNNDDTPDAFSLVIEFKWTIRLNPNRISGLSVYTRSAPWAQKAVDMAVWCSSGAHMQSAWVLTANQMDVAGVAHCTNRPGWRQRAEIQACHSAKHVHTAFGLVGFASAPEFYCRHYSGWTRAIALDMCGNLRVLLTKGTQYIKNMSTLHSITLKSFTARDNSLKTRESKHALLLSSEQPYSLPLRGSSWRYGSLLAEERTEPGSPCGLCLLEVSCRRSSHGYFCAKLHPIAPRGPCPSGRMGREIPAWGILAGVDRSCAAMCYEDWGAPDQGQEQNGRCLNLPHK